MDTPPKPAAWPDLINDELPLLTETVGEPAIPLLSEQVASEPPPAVASPVSPPPARQPEPMAQIERELQAAARLIMQEVIDDYMLQIEAELHRRLEDHLASLLRAGRR